MTGNPRAFNEIPSSALRTAILGAVLSALAARSIEKRPADVEPARPPEDAEFTDMVQGQSLTEMLTAVFGPLPLCDDPSCKACMAERSARGAASKKGPDGKANAQEALRQAAKALAEASGAVEAAAKALVLSVPERA